jgi:murein DD-endopeptidase MepM/ murein hydrolase activator NlpD
LNRATHPLRAISPAPEVARPSRRSWLWAPLGALLCSGVAVAAMPSRTASVSDDMQWHALGIAPLARGGQTGLRMEASAAVEPIAVAPERQQLDFELVSAGEATGAMLLRAGASYADAAQAASMIGAIPAGTKVHLVLGERATSGRAISSLELTPRMDLKVRIKRANGTLELTREQLAVDMTPLRIRGRAGDGLYFALRAAGASPRAAAEYLQAVGAELDVGSDIGPNDSFDLILASRKTPNGERLMGPLLYAGVQRLGARPIQLVRWTAGGRSQWIDAASLDQPQQQEQGSGMAWPVAGRITSTFGWRVHPILRFARMHKGVDFGAAWGSPIVAAASGQVTMAGWAGGYGRQVRISHGGGLVTSYSHMSSIAAQPGSFVRQGQVIGYVGASGLATGAHLHYEVYQSGQAVNPLGVRFASAAPAMGGAQAKAIKARLQALLKVGTKQS